MISSSVKSRTTAVTRCCFPVPCIVGYPQACASCPWCPPTPRYPSSRPGSLAGVHTLSVSACERSILFFARQALPAGSRRLFLWTGVQETHHLRRIPAAPACPMDSGSRSIRLPQPAHRAWCPASRISPCWHRHEPVRFRFRSL